MQTGVAEDAGHEVAVAFIAQAFSGVEPLEMLGKIGGRQDGRLKTPARNVDPGDPCGLRASRCGRRCGGRCGLRECRRGQHGHQKIAASGIEQGLVSGDAWCHDPRHLASQEAFCCLGVINLLADGHPATGCHQFDQLRIELVVREARHRHRVGPLFAACDGEVQKFCSLAGVIAEEFVEVSHPEEHERSGAAGLGSLKLLHHRCGHRPGNVANRGPL